MATDDNPYRSPESSEASVAEVSRRGSAIGLGMASVIAASIPFMILLGTFLAFLAGLPPPTRLTRILIVDGFGATAAIALLLGIICLFKRRFAAGSIAVVLGGLQIGTYFLAAGALK